MRNDDQHRKRGVKALTITVVILAMIVVVAYFARQQVTSWLTYAAAGQSAVNGLRGQNRLRALPARRDSGRRFCPPYGATSGPVLSHVGLSRLKVALSSS